MAKVIITENLKKDVFKIFKDQSTEIFLLMRSLEDNPKKGKEITAIGSTLLCEIRYKKFRFYYITIGYKIKFLQVEELNDTLIKFVRMSEKTNQQKVIEEIKYVLRNIGEGGFS